MPVEHYATVGKLVKLFTRHPMDPIYNRIIINTVYTEYPAPWWDEYDAHHAAIDRSLGYSWYNQVVPLCPDPDEVSGTSPQLVCGNIIDDYITKGFLAQNITALKQLWELESVEFNPIYNYDRTSTITTIRSGSESNQTLYKGGTSNTHKEGTYIDVSTDKIGARTVSGKESHGAYTEESTTTGSQTHKNNQSQISTHHDTSYDTNLINTDEIQYSGDADQDTSQTTTTGGRGAYDDSSKSTQDATTDETTYKAGERTHTDIQTYSNDRSDISDKVYNNVTDTTSEKTEGNIGVTTATAMMTEYKDYYIHYSFWKEFWKLWVAYACSPIYSTDIADYADWI